MSTPVLFSDADRYSRQILFPPIGLEGQRRLGRAHAVIVGCGATGAAAASLLARAGVGTLTLIDRDFVEPSNLQRQMLYDEADARDALPKAEAARHHLSLVNAAVTVHAHIADLTPTNVRALLSGAHIILDGTDNFETRFLLNDFAVEQTVPWIYAAAIGAYAATLNILPLPPVGTGSSSPFPFNLATACLACLFPAPPSGSLPTCDTAGILATAVNLAASLQVTEALKYLTGQPEAMRRTLFSFDLWTGEHSQVNAAAPDPGCTVCGQRTFRHLSGVDRPHITLCGRNSVQIHEHRRPVDLAALAERLRRQPDISSVRSNGLLLRFERSPHTLTLFADGRALIHGTTDPALARSLYARFIGL